MKALPTGPEVVSHLKQSLQLDQSSLEQPDCQTKQLIRCFARKAKLSNRGVDVIKHLREMTPAGTTGEFKYISPLEKRVRPLVFSGFSAEFYYSLYLFTCFPPI